jgi:hypothetical protein
VSGGPPPRCPTYMLKEFTKIFSLEILRAAISDIGSGGWEPREKEKIFEASSSSRLDPVSRTLDWIMR